MGRSRADEFREHLESLPDDERQRVLTRTTGQIYLATQSVCQQANRLRASHSVTHTEHQSDGIFFVFALHVMIQLMDVAARLADPENRSNIEAAVELLKASAGDNREARDVLSHLDEYVTGFGKHQSEAGVRPLPWFSRVGTKYTVRVGDYSIDVDAAEAAALEAFATVLPLDL